METVTVHNVKTGEVIEREMTAEEVTAKAILEAEQQAKAEAEAVKTAARQALLDKLGITADEAKLLLS